MSTDEPEPGGFAPAEAAPWEADGQAGVVRRQLLLGAAALVTGCAGAGVLRMLGTPAHADRALDVQMLQTSASVENLAVELYEAALQLPVVGGEEAEPLVRDFFARTRDQHAAHAKAFNAALTELGARTQGNADPALRELVTRARSGADAARAVDAAIAVETAAAATFQSNAAALVDADARRVTAAIGGVEAQHVAVLLTIAAMLRDGTPEFLRLSPRTVEDLPPEAGSLAFPAAFATTDRARPPAEGAVR